MQDQVQQLHRRNIKAACIHAALTTNQIINILEQGAAGDLKLLYIAPERLDSDLFLEYAPAFNINLIAVDEAHCISQWGHDFRPAYRKINTVKTLFPNTPIIALTASANDAVQKDIAQQLHLKTPAYFSQSIVRDNLIYQVQYVENKPTFLIQYFEKNSASAIVYCRSRKRTVETALALKAEGIKAGYYHAGMPKKERDAVQQRWMDSHDMVICATSAFGMGIDKPNVSTVLHLDVTENIEEYYQEAGRAGRDGALAKAILLYNQQDVIRLQGSTDTHYPPEDFIYTVYESVANYLQIAQGDGNEILYPFNAVHFAQTFQLPLLPCLSALKLLERDAFWIWSESAKTQNIVQFTTDIQTLRGLEQYALPLHEIASCLLRFYGSIFHYPTAVNIYELSKILNITVTELLQGFLQLKGLGLIHFQEATAEGTLFWTHNRVPKMYWHLNSKRIKTLRQAHEERIVKMNDYIVNTNTCRNVLLATYFSEHRVKPCGACDNCLKERITKNFDSNGAQKKIMALLTQHKNIYTLQLLTHFDPQESSAVIEVLRHMQEEHICSIDSLGRINILK
jgi:ATP-dependent DNA helicase RecQ